MSDILAVIVVLAVGIFLALAVVQLRRRRQLLDSFSPDNAHALSDAEIRHDTEPEVSELAIGRGVIELVPFRAAAVARYRDQWDLIQKQFVDAPLVAVSHAHLLITAMMHERGYPIGDELDRTPVLSVDHAEVIDRYRRACVIEAASRHSQVAGEVIRVAMTQYLALFDRRCVRPDRDRPGRQVFAVPLDRLVGG